MHFDDSFFEDSDGCKKKRADKQKVAYTAKRCEPEWFVIGGAGGHHDSPAGDFMLLKYRADLLYHRKQFAEALTCYTQILEVLPKSNTTVTREVVDSLARCCLHTRDFSKALETARLLVLPPHSRDPSSWRLLAQCFQQLGESKEQLLALQKCAMLQRHHPPYWIAVSEAYTSCRLSLRAARRDGESDEGGRVLKHVESILGSTVALFRPYFSWKLRNPRGSMETVLLDPNSQDSMLLHRNDDPTEVLKTDSREPCSADTSLQSCKPATSGVQKAAGTLVADDRLGWDEVDTGSKSSSVSPCKELSGESKASVSGSNGFLQVKTMTSGALESDCTNSPFAVLASGKMSVKCFLEQFGQLSEGNACQLLTSFYEMAACSSLIWARQLLLYSERYSSSFAREAQQVQLKRVEQLLDCCHGNTVRFLLQHFCHNHVFDTSTTEDDGL